MDGIGRTCLGCQAELGPHARFCAKVRAAGGTAVPGPRPAARSPAAPCPAIRCPGQATDLGSPSWRRRPRHRRPPAGTSRPRRRPPSPTGPTRHRSRRRGPRPCPVLRRPVPCRHTHCPLASGRPTSQGSASSRPRTRKASGPSSPRCNRRQGRRRGRRPGRRASRPGVMAGADPARPLALWVILLALLVGGGVAGVLIAHPFSHARPPRGREHRPAARHARRVVSGTGGSTSAASPAASGTGSTATSATASPSATAVTEQQAATSVASMLSQSVSDRAAISNAATDVGDCGPKPGVGPQGLRRRRQLTASRCSSSLTAMPGRAALPPALRQRPHQGVAGVDHRGPGLRQVGERRVHPGLRPQRHDRPRIPGHHHAEPAGDAVQDGLRQPSGTRSPPSTASPSTSRGSCSSGGSIHSGSTGSSRQRIAVQTRADRPLIVSMPYCSVGLPVVKHGDQVVAAVAGDPADAVDLPVGVRGVERQPAVLQRHRHPGGDAAGDPPALAGE